MAGRVINYYAGGNTALGFYSFYESNLKGLDRLFILKGGPGTGKSTLMKKIGQKWKDKGYDIELLHCSSDNNSIDGVIIPKLKVGVVDGTAPHDESSQTQKIDNIKAAYSFIYKPLPLLLRPENGAIAFVACREFVSTKIHIFDYILGNFNSK